MTVETMVGSERENRGCLVGLVGTARYAAHHFTGVYHCMMPRYECISNLASSESKTRRSSTLPGHQYRVLDSSSTTHDPPSWQYD
jgi:hypothetical protein